MNPFERLKKTIDNVGLTYIYPEDEGKSNDFERRAIHAEG